MNDVEYDPSFSVTDDSARSLNNRTRGHDDCSPSESAQSDRWQVTTFARVDTSDADAGTSTGNSKAAAVTSRVLGTVLATGHSIYAAVSSSVCPCMPSEDTHQHPRHDVTDAQPGDYAPLDEETGYGMGGLPPEGESRHGSVAYTRPGEMAYTAGLPGGDTDEGHGAYEGPIEMPRPMPSRGLSRSISTIGAAHDDGAAESSAKNH
ncbi:hypothetical protein I316_07716 [Kwoniella heveanensis BCC8398]|uniref:Uncharacterized protein n=1 Tax=Kwoniella heveanensis BCC8398 TaxID=1296120 RepID=A0A1B9GI26_9TREE|nr:hypothetical protein I316_07716 [Kwoniella heveanensis BCC8398]